MGVNYLLALHSHEVGDAHDDFYCIIFICCFVLSGGFLPFCVEVSS